MNKHSILSSSKTKIWTKCPGSIVFLKENEEFKSESNEAAAYGTCVHKIIEYCLLYGSEPSSFKGYTLTITNNLGVKKVSMNMENKHGHVFIVGDEIIESANKMVEYVRKKASKMKLHVLDVKIEERVNPLPQREDTFGTADVILNGWPDKIEIIDYKNGNRVYVDVIGNEQLKSYALGAIHNKYGRIIKDYKEVTYTICQPRHSQTGVDGISSETIKIDDLLEWKYWLLEKAKRYDASLRLSKAVGYTSDTLSDQYKNGFISSEKNGEHCLYCTLKAICPSLKEKVVKVLNEKLDGINEIKTDFIDENSNDELKSLSSILPELPVIEKWIKEVKIRAKNLLTKGEKIDGYKIVEGSGRRKWIYSDESDILSRICQDYGLKEKDVLKIISGPQVEKLIPKKDKKKFNDDLLRKTSSGNVVVRDSDKRKSIVKKNSPFEGVDI